MARSHCAYLLKCPHSVFARVQEANFLLYVSFAKLSSVTNTYCNRDGLNVYTSSSSFRNTAFTFPITFKFLTGKTRLDGCSFRESVWSIYGCDRHSVKRHCWFDTNKAILSASMVCYVYFFDDGCEGSSYGRYVEPRYLWELTTLNGSFNSSMVPL
jgi:hypothetical protein